MDHKTKLKNASEFLKKINEKITIVYHLASNLDENDPDVFSDNVTTTKNITEFCKEKNIRLILMSSCGVLGDTKYAKENFNFNPKTEYEKSKTETEKIVLNSGLDYTIIRAPIIIGPNKIWKKIFSAAKKNFPLIGSGKNHFHLVYVDDVAELLFKLKDKKPRKKIFHIATKDTPTYKEVYSYIVKCLGKKMTKKNIPISVMLFFSFLYSIFCKIKKKKIPLFFTKSIIQRLTRDRIIITENIHSIRFSPKYSTKDAIEKTVDYFRKRSF